LRLLFSSAACFSLLFSQEVEFSCSGGMTTQRFEQFRNRYGLDVFIETGTWHGVTTANAAPYFKTVYTIELSNELYDIASANLKSFVNVNPILGPSEIELEKLLKELGPISSLVFLDAHYSCGDTAKGEIDPPLLNELVLLNDYIQKDTVIIVDDVRCFESKFITNPNGYPKLSDIKNYINSSYPKGFGFYIIGDQALVYNPLNYNDVPTEAVKLITDLYVEQDASKFLDIAFALRRSLTDREKAAVLLMAEKGTDCLAMINYIAGLITNNTPKIKRRSTGLIKSSEYFFNKANKAGMSSEIIELTIKALMNE